MNKHKVIIKIITNNFNKLINKINDLDIKIFSISYLNDSIIIKVNYDDYLKLKKRLFYYDIYLLSDLGLYNIRNKIKKYYILLISLVIGLILFFFLNNIIIKVNVIHSNSYIRHIVTKSLEEEGIAKFRLKKSYDEIAKIKGRILNKYPEDLEWIEIEVVGMTYQVKIEQRVLTKEQQEDKTCHIVANKNAIITRIIPEKGESIVNVNKYVKKDDILITGEIKYNEVVKSNVCAKGLVYGEVWYTVKVTLPLEYESNNYTGKKRFNLSYEYKKSSNTIFKNRLKNYITKKKKLFSLFGATIYLNTDYEVVKENKKYNEEDALNKGLELAKEKILLGLNENERILSQKVLKKSINDSKMELEVFTSVEELISKSIYYDALPPENKESNDES